MWPALAEAANHRCRVNRPTSRHGITCLLFCRIRGRWLVNSNSLERPDLKLFARFLSAVQTERRRLLGLRVSANVGESG
jgi:hypothetical protein